MSAYASSTTYISGMAVKKAAEAARVRIVERAARLLRVDADEIVLRDRRAWALDGQSISMGDIALNALHTEDQEQIMGTASHWSTESPAPFAAQLAEIEVDVDTGQITVNKLVMAVDCGVAINPVTASGQVEGGMVQALGYALSEETLLDDLGRPLNAALWAVLDLPVRRHADHGGLPRADDGGFWPLRGKVHRRDRHRCRRSCGTQRRSRRDRCDHRRDPLHARACLACLASPADS